MFHDRPLASENGFKEIVEFLILKGADINKQDSDGDTPLILSLQNRHKAIAHSLIQNGAHYSIYESAMAGDIEYMRVLLSQKPELLSTTYGKFGNSLLHAASIGGSVNIVRLLLEKGMDINIRNNNGMTPLHYAARYGEYKDEYNMAIFLVTRKSDINAKDAKDLTPLTYAKLAKTPDMVDFLHKHGAKE